MKTSKSIVFIDIIDGLGMKNTILTIAKKYKNKFIKSVNGR